MDLSPYILYKTLLDLSTKNSKEILEIEPAPKLCAKRAQFWSRLEPMALGKAKQNPVFLLNPRKCSKN
jgi:hypothetical protein